jgi:hypothetical protein
MRRLIHLHPTLRNEGGNDPSLQVAQSCPRCLSFLFPPSYKLTLRPQASV